MLTALSYLATFAFGWFLNELLTAPTGYEDRAGFHFGEPSRYFRKIGNTFEPIGEPDQATLDEFYRAAERRAAFDAESG